MVTLIDWLVRHLRGVVLAITVLVSLVLLAQPSDAGISQARWVGIRAVSMGQRALKWPIVLADLSMENSFLRGRVLELSRTQVSGREEWLENIRLRKALRFVREQNWSYLTARVVAYGPDSPPTTAVLDVGSNHGVATHGAVLGHDGLVGLVDRPPTSNRSIVRLLTHPRSRVTAVIQNVERPVGIVRWEDGKMILEHVSAESQVAPGDSVVSSGLGGVFPAGLMVGVVSAVSHDPHALFQEVELIPAAATTMLEEVFVVRYTSRPEMVGQTN